jgi:hypothetical protein
LWLERLTPDQIIDSVLALSPDWFRARGLRALILDLDNTLVPYGGRKPSADVLAHIGLLVAGGIKAAILSNAGSYRTRAAAAELGIPFVAHAGKPGLRGYRRVLQAIDSRPEQTAAVGDQVFRDVLGAKSAGCYAVLVRPLSPRDFPGTRLLRLPERLLLDYLARRRATPPPRPAPPSGPA